VRSKGSSEEAPFELVRGGPFVLNWRYLGLRVGRLRRVGKKPEMASI
jgi:hypothetical protein